MRPYTPALVFVVASMTVAGPARAESPVVPAGAPTDTLVAAGAVPERLYGDLKFGEGPAWHSDGYLLFEDGPRNRIMKLDAASGQVSVFREPSDRSNGLAFDAKGRLVACEGDSAAGGRRVTRTELDGTRTTLVDRWDGKRLNSPNDLAIDGHGRIYFTDPRYNNRVDLEQEKEAVYRIDPDGKTARIVHTLTRPNGILVTPDDKTLYVADNASPGGVVQLWGFDLDAAGNTSNGRVLYDFVSGRGIDGMALDTAGRIWATAGTEDKAGIYVFGPDAKRARARLLTVIKTPEDPTNCTFGGKDRDVLYITTITSLFKLQTAVKGRPSPPGK